MHSKFKYWAGRVFMAALVCLFVFAFAYTLPADFALLAAIDMATYVDAFIGVYIVSRITRLRPMLSYLRLRLAVQLRRSGKRVRQIRVRREPGKTTAANDDRPAFAIAA